LIRYRERSEAIQRRRRIMDCFASHRDGARAAPLSTVEFRAMSAASGECRGRIRMVPSVPSPRHGRVRFNVRSDGRLICCGQAGPVKGVSCGVIMSNLVPRCLTLVTIIVACLAQPVLAREHAVGRHRVVYRHYRVTFRTAYRHRAADRYGHRRIAAAYRYRHHRIYVVDRQAPPPAFMAWSGAPNMMMQRRQRASWRMTEQQQSVAGSWSFGETPNPYWRRDRAWSPENPAANAYSDNGEAPYGGVESLAAEQASANGVPLSLVDRVIRRESGGNPRAVSRGNFGLMQIRLGTARTMGYGGSASGLLDAQTNMIYAVRYLAGAYRAAGGNESRAVALYARGYNAAPANRAL
jgi:soluble lytic murein transglycosylase-like protein